MIRTTALVLFFGGLNTAAHAVVIYGGPTYDEAARTGSPTSGGTAVATGLAVGSATKSTAGVNAGSRAIRLDTFGVTELGGLGTDAAGVTSGTTTAINAGGVAVGSVGKYAAGTSLGQRAVRWDPGSTAATELGTLGAPASGVTNSYAVGVNNAGTVAGYASKFIGNRAVGQRAVRWDAGGTVATELDNLGTSDSVTMAVAQGINSGGTIVGYANKYGRPGYFDGTRPVRWDAGGTAATELGILGVSSDGFSYSFAFAVNDNGTTVGQAFKYVGTTFYGNRAVRWDAGSTVATELGVLGTDANGQSGALASAINAAGTAIGYLNKYDAAGVALGSRAVRWDAGSTAAVELDNLGTDANGVTSGRTFAINDAGLIAGTMARYTAGVNVGNRAVVWDTDGAALDLNTLLSSADAAVWTLTTARGISDTNWVTGTGTYDPDGIAGPLVGYPRAFLLQIPEPASTAVVGIVGTLLTRRRRPVALIVK